MIRKTKIEWTEATWNPSIGCSKISEGCKNCYAEVMARRLKAMGSPEYENGFAFHFIPNRLNIPQQIKRPTNFFVNSMSDLFHEEMPFSFIDQVFNVIRSTPQHNYQILTKRAGRLAEYCANMKLPDNVWLGVTVENSDYKDRIDTLRNINANIRFLSIEPLLGNIGLLNLKDIHWVIVGGESGMCARPIKEEWVLSIKKQCENQGVAFFFKQWGTWGADGKKRSKKENGSLLLGKEWKQKPLSRIIKT